MKLLVSIVLLSTLQLQSQSRQAEKLFELGQQKFYEKKWSEALEYFNQCLMANPALAEAYLLRGKTKEQLEKSADALTDYSIAIELNQLTAEAYLNRAVLAFKLNRFDLARIDFRKLLSIRNTETNTVYFRQSNNESIDKVFTAQSGIRDMVYNYLGLIEAHSGENQKGILYFDSAISINSQTADYYAHRARAHLNLGDQQKAMNDFYLALKIDPDHAVSKNNLAAIKRKEGKLAEAEQFLNEAKSVNKNAPNHHADLGLLQLEDERFTEAILNFDTAIALDPQNGELYINRGLAKEKLNDLEGASRDFDKALRIDSEWPKAWFVQGNNFMKQKKWQEALENYTVAITYDEHYASAYYNRAIVKYNLGEQKQACEDLLIAETKGMTIEKKMRDRICDQ
jgi:tetratricopeptide (TPR) repeat protein